MEEAVCEYARDVGLKFILGWLSCVLLVANRLASKMALGPIFYLDILLFLGFCLDPKGAVDVGRRVFSCLVFFFVGLVWLIFDFYYLGFDILFLRRFAFSLYILVPIFMILYGGGVANLIWKYKLLVFFVVTLLYFFNVSGFQASLSSQLLSIVLLGVLLSGREVSMAEIFFMVGSFFYVSMGMNGDGLYKTPLLGFLLAISFSAYLVLFRFLFKGGSIGIYTIQFIHFAFIFALISLMFPFGQQILVEVINTLAGLFDSAYLKSLAASFGDYQVRSRGSSYDTAGTRVIFWVGIFKYSLSDIGIFLFGNGHSLSFMERVFPEMPFVDVELLEPHNSFVGAFYRYGFLGLLLLTLSLIQTRVFLSKRFVPSKVYLYSSTIVGLVYLSFEVALESPHGAFFFWFIWFLPYFWGEKRGAYLSQSLDGHNVKGSSC